PALDALPVDPEFGPHGVDHAGGGAGLHAGRHVGLDGDDAGAVAVGVGAALRPEPVDADRGRLLRYADEVAAPLDGGFRAVVVREVVHARDTLVRGRHVDEDADGVA